MSVNQGWKRPYSFSDIDFTIMHPAVGQYSLQGKGLGSVTITDSTDKSASDVAADGNTMISKIKNNAGALAVSVQQNSDLDKWLLNLFNYLQAAPSDEWALTRVNIRAPKMKETHNCTGVAPLKRPDRGYAAQGAQLTWNFLVADLESLPI